MFKDNIVKRTNAPELGRFCTSNKIIVAYRSDTIPEGGRDDVFNLLGNQDAIALLSDPAGQVYCDVGFDLENKTAQFGMLAA